MARSGSVDHGGELGGGGGGIGIWIKKRLQSLDLQRLTSLYFVLGWLQTISYVTLKIPFLYRQ